MSKKTRPIAPLALLMALALLFGACAEAEPETTPPPEEPDATEPAPDPTDPPPEPEVDEGPETIVIGNAIALSGPNNAGAALTQIPTYDLWVEDVNAEGGIYVAEYDRRIPVEILRYDTTSDIGTAVSLVERLIVEDEVHFLFPPWGTAFNFAILPIVNEHGMPTLACTMTSKEVITQAHNFPYWFILLNQPPEQGAALVELATELGIETAAVIHHNDLHGIEFAGEVVPQLSAGGVEVVLYRTYPAFTDDLSSVLREAQAADVDALIAFSYPPETFLMRTQMQEIGFNPDFFYATVAVAFPSFRDAFGIAGVEGVMGAGTWNPNVPVAGAREFFDRHVAMHGTEPDRWASASCYATGEVLAQAIEMAGTLDREAVREAIATGEFETVLGTVRFENQLNVTYPGHVGQWQDGEFEVVAPAELRTADPIYPKPAWPEE